MKLRVSFVLFGMTAVSFGMVSSLGDTILAAQTVLFAWTGLHVAIFMGLRRYFYTAMLFAFHVGFTVFISYIYLNRYNVVRQNIYDFSVFTEANLKIALSALGIATLAVFVPWLFLSRDATSIYQLSPRAMAREVLGRLDRLSPVWFNILVGGSFIIGLALFLSNSSVLDVSYPYQGRTHWVPRPLLKVPTFLALIALAFAYAGRLTHGPRWKSRLLAARLNFLVTLVLMLLLTGSRGLFNFLWLFIGFFEFFLWTKRRGSLAWSLVFLAAAWVAFQSWPYMRWNLSLLPLDEVLWEGMRIGLGLAEHRAVRYGQEIRLGDLRVIGMSLFHLLYVVQLIEDGVSLGGMSFVNLIPQALPSWLDGIVWDRPVSDGWPLGELYRHSGGFLFVANVYWNGGLWVTAVFMSVLAAIFVGFDRRLANPRAGLLYRVVYWLWLPVMMVNLAYGIQGLARVIELLVAVIVVENLFSRTLARRSRARAGARWQ